MVGLRGSAHFALLALVALLLAVPCSAHFVLRDPAPYNPIDCHKPLCQKPCPPIWLSGPARAQWSPENPARKWSRGDEVDIEWHRNNHEGGFYRYSLVPVKHMYSWRMHLKFAFEYGCWATNLWECGTDSTCGTDDNGFAYKNRMRVPNVFPDGDYVFAMSWFGGLHWRRKRGFFPDYHSCSFVRIEGGEPWGEWRPKFKAGISHHPAEKVTPGMCVSSSAWIGECGGTGCRQRSPYRGMPGPFQGKRRPKMMNYKDLARYTPNRATRRDMQFGTMREELRYILENAFQHHRDNRDMMEMKKEMKENEEKRNRRQGGGGPKKGGAFQ